MTAAALVAFAEGAEIGDNLVETLPTGAMTAFANANQQLDITYANLASLINGRDALTFSSPASLNAWVPPKAGIVVSETGSVPPNLYISTGTTAGDVVEFSAGFAVSTPPPGADLNSDGVFDFNEAQTHASGTGGGDQLVVWRGEGTLPNDPDTIYLYSNALAYRVSDRALGQNTFTTGLAGAGTPFDNVSDPVNPQPGDTYEDPDGFRKWLHFGDGEWLDLSSIGSGSAGTSASLLYSSSRPDLAQLTIEPHNAEERAGLRFNAPNRLFGTATDTASTIWWEFGAVGNSTDTRPANGVRMEVVNGENAGANTGANFQGFSFSSLVDTRPHPAGGTTSNPISVGIDAVNGNILLGNGNGNRAPSDNLPKIDSKQSANLIMGVGFAPDVTTTSVDWGNIWYDSTGAWKARNGAVITTFAPHNPVHRDILGIDEDSDAWLLGANNGENVKTMRGSCQLKSDPSITATYSLSTGDWKRYHAGVEVASGNDERLKQ